MKAKGDVERKDCDGFTALHDAAVSGRLCVDNIASINIPHKLKHHWHFMSTDNLEACRLIRRYLLNSVHQNTIVEEAADQARDHGHDIIGTWLEVSRSSGAWSQLPI